MNGKAQYYLNIGITLIIGLYGVIAAFYSEMLKPHSESNGKAIAVDLIFILLLATAAIDVLKKCYSEIDKDSELPK